MVFFRPHIYKLIKSKYSSVSEKYQDLKPPWKVLFFGSDEFSLTSLKVLCKEYRTGNILSKLEVVTSMKSKQNVVHSFALRQSLALHNYPLDVPQNSYDIGFVVSFGYLIPERIINSFPLGMLNIHASLLPRWRGAAPIIYAIANGDTVTGVTVMRIKPNHFDVGEIISQARIDISKDMIMPELHEKLAKLGAENLLKCLRELPACLENAKVQTNEGVTLAPRVKSSFAHVQWNKMTAKQVYDLHRSLVSLFPLATTWKGNSVKLYDVFVYDNKKLPSLLEPGLVSYDKQSKTLTVQCADGHCIRVARVGVVRKKIMTACDFNNGFVKKEPLECRVFV